MPRPRHLSSPRTFAAAVASEAPLRAERARMEIGLARAGRSGREVVVGPWLSEIGFEVLYWIPLLRRLLERHGVRPEQVTAISRGGVHDWYADVAARYVEIHDLMGVDEFRDRQAQRIAAAGDQKQLRVTPMDREIWRRAGAGGALLVHPLVMYSRLRYYWAGQEDLRAAEQRCLWRRFQAPPAPDRPLPASFVAAKLYFSDCFPDTRANRDLVRRLLAAIAEREDVVLLTTGLGLDDHEEFDLRGNPRIHGIGDLRPSDNLAVQTRILARARVFIGTYGGPAYLAPGLGVRSVSLVSVDNHNPRHLEAGRRAAAIMGSPEPVLVDAAREDAAQAVLGALT